MKQFLQVCKVCILGVLLTCFSATAQTITLKDGSEVTGKVVSMNGGTYQIQTTSMGIISIPQTEVISINAGSIGNASDIQGFRQSIESDPQMMTAIKSLQSDPLIQGILQDPQIMQAIQSGDLESLSQNPKIQQLMNHSAVKDISRQLE